MKRFGRQWLIWICLLALGLPAQAADWSWQWDLGTQANLQAEITPFRFGKDWAYAIEIDDNPKSTLTVVEPMLKTLFYTDAPTGITGGKPMRFVGSTAAIVSSIVDTENDRNLSWNDLRTLINDDGWGLVSHSYYHRGYSYGKNPEILTPEEFRQDFFWSQSIFAAELGNGRAPTHLVYPNGYTDYGKYLGEFGMLSASRVSAGFSNPVYDEKFDLRNLTRSYLDEGYWKNSGKGEPMAMFPKDGPAKGILHIDFTHGVSADPQSENHQRWLTRLDTIADTYGAKGKDNMWMAPTGEVVDYVNARKTATVTLKDGKLTVALPDTGPGASLTLHLTGLPQSLKLSPPQGTVFYQRGTEAWITTPMIGLPGAAAPKPHVKRHYAGAVQNLHFDQPVQIAAVRLFYTAPPPPDFQFVVEADGHSLVPDGFVNPKGGWNRWQLFSTVPNRPAISATDLKVAPLPKSLQRMEVWIVE